MGLTLKLGADPVRYLSLWVDDFFTYVIAIKILATEVLREWCVESVKVL